MLSYITFPIHTQYQPWQKENESGGNLEKNPQDESYSKIKRVIFFIYLLCKKSWSRQFVNRKALNWDKKNTKCYPQHPPARATFLSETMKYSHHSGNTMIAVFYLITASIISINNNSLLAPGLARLPWDWGSWDVHRNWLKQW